MEGRYNQCEEGTVHVWDRLDVKLKINASIYKNYTSCSYTVCLYTFVEMNMRIMLELARKQPHSLCCCLHKTCMKYEMRCRICDHLSNSQ